MTKENVFVETLRVETLSTAGSRSEILLDAKLVLVAERIGTVDGERIRDGIRRVIADSVKEEGKTIYA